KRDARVKSATYFVTMVDFTEAGELSVFIDEEQLRALEQRMSKRGYLEARDMHQTFNMLRANDLIWSFVVNNYLLGKQPFPFDLRRNADLCGPDKVRAVGLGPYRRRRQPTGQQIRALRERQKPADRGRMARRRHGAPRLVVAGLGALGRRIRRGRGAGAPA